MSNYAATNIAGITVKASIDWANLGSHLSRERNDDQVQFLEAFAEGLHAMGHHGDLQLEFMAEWINDAENMCSARDIKWLLSGLAERINP